MHRKVLCPVERKDGSTFWLRTGNAFDNKDGSINIFLDLLPNNGRLQIREFNERDRERMRKPPESADEPSNESLPF